MGGHFEMSPKLRSESCPSRKNNPITQCEKRYRGNASYYSNFGDSVDLLFHINRSALKRKKKHSKLTYMYALLITT